MNGLVGWALIDCSVDQSQLQHLQLAAQFAQKKPRRKRPGRASETVFDKTNYEARR
jgi:hypothetical protein